MVRRDTESEETSSFWLFSLFTFLESCQRENSVTDLKRVLWLDIA